MTLLYLLIAILSLGILVFFHELGHYFVALKSGMEVEVFSIGFGKSLIEWKSKKGVLWKVGWLPFGGFVKIKGMDFAQKEQDIYAIENGFFRKSPYKRMAVAVAGPVANFILAFLLFGILWFAGGRERPFSEFTHIIGSVDPSSELYAQGVRPGDEISSLNGKSYTQSKDLLYQAMISDKVTVSGYHIDYATKTKKPFTYTVVPYQMKAAAYDLKTLGIDALSRYLIYTSTTPLQEGMPMASSGIQKNDRLVWADGQMLFSMEQLSSLLNDSKSLITIDRKGEQLLVRQELVQAGELYLSGYQKEELQDLHYAAFFKTPLAKVEVLPYEISSDLIVESSLSRIQSEAIEYQLQSGDQIIAVDGQKVASGAQLLQALQNKAFHMIVKKDSKILDPVSWKKEDQDFISSLDFKEIDTIASSLGSENPIVETASYKMLAPVYPKKIFDLPLPEETLSQMQAAYLSQKEKIQAMSDEEQKQQATQMLEASYNRYVLGVALEDKSVRYNPSPFKMFGLVFSETYSTLKALFSGSLHPKWVSGPVGIIQVMHKGLAMGWREGLFWVCAISVNLGFLNLLPIPVLDGGYICFALWEIVTKKQLKAKTMERLVIPFVVLLIGFLIFFTFQDITRIFH